MPKVEDSIDSFLEVVLYRSVDQAEQAQTQRQSQGYMCPSAKDLAVHLILELYDQGSSPEGNITRIASNLEIAAEELLYLSRRIGSLWRI